MFSKLFKFFLLIIVSTNLLAAEQIVLQLKWEHEFQFAGYYAAKWQGFYRDEGLDVDIRSAIQADKSFISPKEEITNGNAQFAIGALDILINKNEEMAPVILASIFQKSPTAIFSLQKTDISSLENLSKLRIAAPESDFAKTEIRALFRSQGYDLNKIKFVNQPITIDTLINDKADAIVTYDISANFSAIEKNINLNKLSPADLGIDFYGDSLYTSLAYANKHPDIVKKFTEASKKGWVYALQHKEEIAQRIANQFPRYLVKYNDVHQYNLFFAEHIDSLIQYPEKPLGDINKDRWINMNERIRSLGLVHTYLNERHFFDAGEGNLSFSNKLIYYLLSIALFLPIIFFLWHRQYKVLTILTVLLAIALFEIQLEKIFVKEEARAERVNATQTLNSVSAKLQGQLQNNLSMLAGFAAYISATPDLSTDDFNRYAKALFQKDPILIDFAGAKDLVVNNVYPLEGNEQAIGLDYLRTPSQSEMVKQVVTTGQITITGPVTLVQGGMAFIGRAPVFLEGGKLWGIISAPINAELLFKFSGIELSQKYFNIAIRAYDVLGNQGPVFFGDATVFDSPEKLQSIIFAGGHSWHIAAVPREKNAKVPTNIYLLRTYFLISALIFSLFIWFRFQQLIKQKKLELKLKDDARLLESVSRVAKIGGWKLDHQLTFIKWAKQSSLALGKHESFVPRTLSDLRELFSAEDYELWKTKAKDALASSRPFDIELQVATNNDKPRWMRVMSDGWKDNSNNYITGTIQNTTEKILNVKLIEYQASFDSLTNLPNRRSFQEKLEQAIKNAHRSKQKLAVLFIDLDHFKPINDNHGHQAGDKVLIEAATRLKEQVRASDTVSRLSGDEFSLILNDVQHYKHALTIAKKISEKMQEPYQLDNNQIHLSVSIGIALYPDDAECADSLLKKADQAMYAVKGNGRNGFQFYTEDMQLKSEHRHQQLNKLIDAINERELQPYFQPIIDLKTKQICKCETLARWPQEDGGFIPPIEFINLAEESGLINKIDLFMLKESSKYLQEMNADTELSINISPRLFQTKDNALHDWLTAIKEISNFINVTVEITERLLTDDSDKTFTILNQLRSLGVKIAIDDFGTGYSSLNYLIKFPVDIIKIDRSFIKKIGVDQASEVLIETILAMANGLSIQVIAEGIETEEQLVFLQKNKCDYGQGYFLGKPMNKENFHSLLKNSKS